MLTWAAAVLVGFLAFTTQAPGSPADAGTDVATVRALYAAAEYEKVLSVVASVAPDKMTPEHELYGALCHLALGRLDLAQQALERLVRMAPRYALPDSAVTPRITAVFRDVRRRVLPEVARQTYAAGRANFDERKFADARREMRLTLDLLAEPDLAYPAEAFADLRQLAEGFIRLADLEELAAARAAQEAASRAAEAEARAAAPPPAPPADELVVTRILIYSAADTDVVAPIDVARPMPAWVPPAAMARAGVEYRGELEVVVDEQGTVEQARMVRPTIPAYDVTLLSAARRWRFQPARRGEAAVKYRVNFDIVLSPRP